MLISHTLDNLTCVKVFVCNKDSEDGHVSILDRYDQIDLVNYKKRFEEVGATEEFFDTLFECFTEVLDDEALRQIKEYKRDAILTVKDDENSDDHCFMWQKFHADGSVEDCMYVACYYADIASRKTLYMDLAKKYGFI